MFSISVVIPVYNSAKTLSTVIEEIECYLPKISNDFEVILVNDGSTDNSWQIIEFLCKKTTFVCGLDLAKNYGQHNALLLGIRQASKDVIVTMDDDLQNSPSSISALVSKLKEGFDVVYGIPEMEQHGLMRNFSSQITKLVMQEYMGIENARNISAFRAFHANLQDSFINFNSCLVSIDVLLTWGTSKFGFVKVPHYPRLHGKSNYTFQKLLQHTFNMLTGFSTLPLHVSSILGFAFMVVSFLILCFVLLRYIYSGVAIPGFAFLAIIISMFAGVQLLVLGFIGEYISRMYLRIIEKPVGIVRSKIPSRLNSQ